MKIVLSKKELNYISNCCSKVEKTMKNLKKRCQEEIKKNEINN